MRVITTGWRHWTGSAVNVSRLHLMLDHILTLASLGGERELQLIHGDAPGADQEVQNWWIFNMSIRNGVGLPPPLKFPADWTHYGSAAGPLRNAAMVTAGADLCVAFMHPTSRGTVDCRDKARRARIFTLQVDWIDDPLHIPLPRKEPDALPFPRAA
jgi:hypothetical protein